MSALRGALGSDRVWELGLSRKGKEREKATGGYQDETIRTNGLGVYRAMNLTPKQAANLMASRRQRDLNLWWIGLAKIIYHI